MILKLKRTPGIYLAGFMACGKTTVGRLLAGELGWKFVDLDELIEQQEGMPIARIFAERGEPAFRAIEKTMIARRVHEIQGGRPQVVALGGGAFVEPGNFELLESNGVSIFLDCPFERIKARLARAAGGRPLAADPAQLFALFEARHAAYTMADHTIEVDTDDPAPVVAAILKLPIF
jgi:shikimate kinase